jgi:hypothetical protein
MLSRCGGCAADARSAPPYPLRVAPVLVTVRTRYGLAEIGRPGNRARPSRRVALAPGRSGRAGIGNGGWSGVAVAVPAICVSIPPAISVSPGAVPVAWPGSGQGGRGCQSPFGFAPQPQPTPLAGFFCAFGILGGQACCICEVGRSALLSTIRNIILEQCITSERLRLSCVGRRFSEIARNIYHPLCDAVPSVRDPGQLAWRHCLTAPGDLPPAPRATAIPPAAPASARPACPSRPRGAPPPCRM